MYITVEELEERMNELSYKGYRYGITQEEEKEYAELADMHIYDPLDGVWRYGVIVPAEDADILYKGVGYKHEDY